MEYYIEQSHWDFDIICKEFEKFIPKGFTPLILYYFKEYDNETYTGAEEYLIALHNKENTIMTFDIIINDKGKYEIQLPTLFEFINFKNIVHKDYLPEGHGPFRYDDRNNPKMLVCDEINKRFLKSLAFFNECDNDGVVFKCVKLLYVEPEGLSEFGKRINDFMSYPFKHNKIEIETSLSDIKESVYQVFNINFFFILVICYDTEREFYSASIYNHIINLSSKYVKYEYCLDLGVDAYDKEEFFDNLFQLYYYDKPNSRLKNISRKTELLIDKSEDF